MYTQQRMCDPTDQIKVNKQVNIQYPLRFFYFPMGIFHNIIENSRIFVRITFLPISQQSS